MSLQRYQQFFRALTANLSDKDQEFIKAFLTLSEQHLFYAMTLSDQYHAFRVAKTSEQLAAAADSTVNNHLLIRCALLHDIGRQKGDMGIAGKVFAVLIHIFSRGCAMKWGKYNPNLLGKDPRHILYVYYHHPEIGAKFLRAAGLEAEAAIVAAHHRHTAPKDPPELILLRQADNMN